MIAEYISNEDYELEVFVNTHDKVVITIDPKSSETPDDGAVFEFDSIEDIDWLIRRLNVLKSAAYSDKS